MESELLEKMYNEMTKRFNQLDDKVDRLTRVKECLDGDKLLDNQDLCQLFNVVPRTIARYRKKQLISYYMIDNGRAYYRASEINVVLKKMGKPTVELPELQE